jgi:hypothetical protein
MVGEAVAPAIGETPDAPPATIPPRRTTATPARTLPRKMLPGGTAVRVHRFAVAIATLVVLVAQAADAATVVRTLRHERADVYSVEIKYPQITDSTPLARLVNRTIDGWVRADVAEFLKAANEAARQQLPGPYEYQGEGTVTFAQPARLISAVLDIYKFAGGAHGDAWYFPFNYGVIEGRLKRLVLGDLFRPNSDHQRLVSTAVIAKLKADKDALWVHDGQMSGLTVEQFNRFSITPRGLVFLFNHYEAGPYASGRFEITLTIQELGPGFRRELLAPR